MSTVSPWLHIVLYQPEIPGNTGAVGRTCVALGAKLWLVRPLGFRIDEKTLRRAGLDYWQHLEWEVADHWEDLMQRMSPQRIWLFSKRATRSCYDVEYQQGDAFIFGSETSGLPDTLIEKHSASLLRIPTTENVRSLNLSCSAAVSAYEACRQIWGTTGSHLSIPGQ